jgi:hypothetical protein
MNLFQILHIKTDGYSQFKVYFADCLSDTEAPMHAYYIGDFKSWQDLKISKHHDDRSIISFTKNDNHERLFVDVNKVETDFESLMGEFLPNVSDDFVCSFHFTHSVFLFGNFFLPRFLETFFPFHQFFLIIKFSDGSVIKNKVTKKQFDYWQDKIEAVNFFLKGSTL